MELSAGFPGRPYQRGGGYDRRSQKETPFLCNLRLLFVDAFESADSGRHLLGVGARAGRPETHSASLAQVKQIVCFGDEACHPCH